MSAASLVAFNLLGNGVASFAVGWLVARAARPLVSARPGRVGVALAALPFVKVAVDTARGVPDASFLWERAHGALQEHGLLRATVGVSWLIPRVDLQLGALAHGRSYSQSAADLAAGLLATRVSAWAPGVIAAAVVVVALARLAARARTFHRTALAATTLRARATLTGHRVVRRRRVPIFVVDDLAGSPFTGGVFAPFVCLPRRVWDALTPAERRAALAHELAHVADHHVLVTSIAGVVRDVFWFVPFAARAERGLRDACELAADAAAVARGAAAEVLASALVRAREAGRGGALAGPVLAATDACLEARVARLLDPPRAHLPILRALFVAWLAAIALHAVTLGNP